MGVDWNDFVEFEKIFKKVLKIVGTSAENHQDSTDSIIACKSYCINCNITNDTILSDTYHCLFDVYSLIE